MNCINCHTGGKYGILNEQFDREEIVGKLMVTQSTSHKFDLTQAELLAVSNCLEAEIASPTVKGAWMEKME